MLMQQPGSLINANSRQQFIIEEEGAQSQKSSDEEKFKPSTSRSSARKMSTWKVAKEAKITISSSNKFYCNRFKSNLVISQSRWGYKTRAAATLEATNWKMTEAVSPSQEVDNISRNCRWTKITNPNKPTLEIIH